MSTQQAASEYAISRNRHAQGATSIQEFPLEPPLQERILDLQINNWVHADRASPRLGADLRQGDVPDIAPTYQIGDGANGVFDRYCGI